MVEHGEGFVGDGDHGVVDVDMVGRVGGGTGRRVGIRCGREGLCGVVIGEIRSSFTFGFCLCSCHIVVRVQECGWMVIFVVTHLIHESSI